MYVALTLELLIGLTLFQTVEIDDARPPLPRAYQPAGNDPRLGRFNDDGTSRLTEDEIARRQTRFQDRVRRIVAQLKRLAREFWNDRKDNGSGNYRHLTRGFAALVNNADAE